MSKSNLIMLEKSFLTQKELSLYNSLLCVEKWTFGCKDDEIMYWSQAIYNNYKWDGDWDASSWKDDTPLEWEYLYNKISKLLPEHYVFWIDLKITPPMCSGTPLHRDKDPWSRGSDAKKFKRTITILCNLNQEWDPSWGGEFVIYKEQDDNIVEDCKIPISPGQLLIMENCYHSIAPITEPGKNRKTFILHVFEYAKN